MEWRDELALRSKRQADYAWTVLARVLSWAKDRGKITVNPCERGGRVYHGTRVDFVWSVEDEAAFLEHAPAHLHSAAVARAVDRPAARRSPAPAVVGLRRSASSGCGNRRPAPASIIPVGAPLKAALDAANEARADHPHLDRRAAMDAGRLPRVMGQGVQEGGHRGRHVQRSARHRRHPARAGRLHRGARSPPSPGTACGTCARSSMRTICTATSSWRGARSPSSKWATRSGPETKRVERRFLKMGLKMVNRV